jgi:hypothetical protein
LERSDGKPPEVVQPISIKSDDSSRFYFRIGWRIDRLIRGAANALERLTDGQRDA